VLAYDKFAPSAEMTWIDYGLGGLSAAVFAGAPSIERDLSSLYRDLAYRRELAGYEASERFHEIGTPEALAETAAYLEARYRS